MKTIFKEVIGLVLDRFALFTLLVSVLSFILVVPTAVFWFYTYDTNVPAKVLVVAALMIFWQVIISAYDTLFEDNDSHPKLYTLTRVFHLINRGWFIWAAIDRGILQVNLPTTILWLVVFSIVACFAAKNIVDIIFSLAKNQENWVIIQVSKIVQSEDSVTGKRHQGKAEFV